MPAARKRAIDSAIPGRSGSARPTSPSHVMPPVVPRSRRFWRLIASARTRWPCADSASFCRSRRLRSGVVSPATRVPSSQVEQRSSTSAGRPFIATIDSPRLPACSVTM
jgi:hypothetical protein